MKSFETDLHAGKISGYLYLKPASIVRLGLILAPVVNKTALSFAKNQLTSCSGSMNKAGRHIAFPNA